MSITAVVTACAAAGAAELVTNGGFETGALPPWTADKMVVSSQGPRSGNYWAYFKRETAATITTAEQIYWGELRQEFGRTYSPASFITADLWVYFHPDNVGSPWYLTVKLGPNYLHLESKKGELGRGWNHVTFPAALVTQPFNDVYVKPSLEYC